ncbi:hypothetical protein PF005_g8310 [Phytophthora fragariae]|uniref:Uncharacterized protein n=1 Tax=Phytophthora fragariae TaxID=53985 RepID=A0A6A3F6R7_9STRA|nr:hypothetical protein PF003_g37341 [Phytophthora fragariae]KAE8941029.1 hypothetical protein PF009_g9173 [Phytophthora fragariae]KAE9016142.1 hypothetical protein PF011_g7288 [Phytophthora fragariae]KAE9114773.1 hypothetical protein PF007_g10254 [Phytophthora fragariae]KAE9120106.1 hypothetical protein PF010_g7615 [Phytophthora fragariae]
MSMWVLKSPRRFLIFALLTIAAMTAASAENHHTHAQRRLATSLANAPSLRLQFTLKRDSMKIYGQSQFYVFANPVVSSDNTSVLYDG